MFCQHFKNLSSVICFFVYVLNIIVVVVYTVHEQSIEIKHYNKLHPKMMANPTSK